MITYLSDEDLVLVWLLFESHWHNEPWRERVFYAMLLLSTGLRIEESTQIRVEDCRSDFVVLVRSGKGNKSRYVEVHPVARPFYSWYIAQARLRKQEYLFPGKRRPKGCPDVRGCVSVRQARDWWREVLDLAGVSYVSPHKARATFATWCADQMLAPVIFRRS